VLFNVSSDDATASTVSPATLTFTEGNWNTPQTVTVTGVVDNVVDADQSSTVTVSVDGSSDPDFKHLADQTVSVTTTNVDAAGFAVDSTSMTMDEGASESFTVVLTGKPTSDADVVFNVSSDNAAATVDKATLTFTNGNWNTPQTVTVTGATVTQDETSTITVSVDGSSNPLFTGLGDQTVTVNTVNVSDNELELADRTVSLPAGTPDDEKSADVSQAVRAEVR